jgi:hypothetical protein
LRHLPGVFGQGRLSITSTVPPASTAFSITDGFAILYQRIGHELLGGLLQ